MSDLIELILADHSLICDLLDTLGEAAPARDGAGALAGTWLELGTLLDLHCEADQEIFYPALRSLAGATAAAIEDAIADHHDLQEAVQEADLQPPGSADWWRSVAAVRRVATWHISREEQHLLVAFARTAKADLRIELGRRWNAFTAARIADAHYSRSLDGRCDQDLGVSRLQPPLSRRRRPAAS